MLSKLPSISSYFLNLTRGIFGQLAGTDQNLAGKFVNSLLPKSPLARSVLSKNIRESISRKAYNEVLPLLLAVSKVSMDKLYKPDKIMDTNEEIVVRQVGAGKFNKDLWLISICIHKNI